MRFAPVLALLPSLALAGQDGRDPSFRLNNRTGETIETVLVHDPGQPRLPIDRLGRSVIPPDGSRLILLPPGPCVHDIEIFFASGQLLLRQAVNTCGITDLVVP
jgi:hypothetical protein